MGDRLRCDNALRALGLALALAAAGASGAPAGAAGADGFQLFANPDAGNSQLLAELARCGRNDGARQNARCSILRGIQQMTAGNTTRARAAFGRSLTILEGLEDRFGIWLLHVVLGATAGVDGDYGGAEAHLSRASEMLRRLESSPRRINLEIFALFARAFGVPAETIDQMITFADLIRPKILLWADVLNRNLLGLALMSQGKLEAAEEQLELVLAASGFLDGLMQGQVLEHLGLLRQLQGREDEARQRFRQALAAADVRGSPQRQLDVYRRLTDLELEAGLLEQALAANKAALELASVLGRSREEALVLTDRVELFCRWDRLDEARRTADKARLSAVDAGDGMVEATVLVKAGGSFLASELFEVGASWLGRAASRLQTLDQRDRRVRFLLAFAHLQLGYAYFRLELAKPMEQELEAARQLALEGGFDKMEAFVQWLKEWRGSSPGGKQEVARATQMLVAALEGGGGRSRRRGLELLAPVLALGMEALELEFQGSGRDAKARLKQLQQLAGASISSELRPVVLALLGALYFQNGRYGEAVESLEQARTSLGRGADRPFEAQLLAAMAAVSWLRGRRREALHYCREAIECLESFLSHFRIDTVMTAILGGDSHTPYQLAVELLATDGQPQAALVYAEKARARALRQSLGNQRFDPTRGADPHLLARMEELRGVMFARERQLYGAASGMRAQLEAELQQARGEYDGLLLRIKLGNPEYASLVSVGEVDLASLQRETLDHDNTVVAYFVTLDRVLAWVIDRERIEMVSLPMAGDELAEVLCLSDSIRWAGMPQPARRSAGRRGVRALDGCARDPDRAARLYRRLFEPLVPYIRHRGLIVIPHDVLHYLPFAALRHPRTGRYLIEDYTVTYVPSASALEHLRRKANPVDGEVLILGNPLTGLAPLAGARHEAQAVAQLFGTTPVLGAQATESLIYQRAGRVDLLHVAAHGIYDPANPRFSRIALTEDRAHDGQLEVHEVWEHLDLRNANLVVLSGCETALGERTRGDEIIGLSRAFLFAGSPSVIATLWPVDDQASSRLMAAFYRRLRAGATAAEALRAAQRELIASSEHAAPYYWAAFTLIGDPRTSWTR